MERDFYSRFIIFTLCLVLVISIVPSRPAVLAKDIIPHDETIWEVVEIGKTRPITSMTPNSKFSFNNMASRVLSISDLWVNAYTGNDRNDGLTRSTAFSSIQRAADIAGPGTTVHILPGIYRETIQPNLSGNPSEPVVYRAENGPGTAIIRGSERASTLVWSQLTTNSIGLPPGVNPGNLYYADLSEWALNGSPRFIIQLGGGVITRLPLAHEPDWKVTTEWKYAEYWWAADGGSSVATCDPASNQNPDCDISSRSTTQLTDRNSDSEPAGIEPGNLTTLGNLTGATLVAMDTDEGHYVYRREIVAHDVSGGRVTVDGLCEFDRGSGNPGLGWGSKYYVENHPALIDAPGEWWYDANNSRLYLWPLIPGNPATQNIEVSRRDYGFLLNSLSYITLDNLTMEFYNDSAVHQSQSCPGCGSYHNTVRNTTLRYANIGIELGQGTDYIPNVTDGFTLENSEVSHMDTLAIDYSYWWSNQTADSFTHAGIVNTVIRNNELYDLGFRTDSDNADGAVFLYADSLRFEGNYVHNIAHNGMVFGLSVIQSENENDFAPGEIKTGQILIKDNIFEKACLLAADCGALKIWGKEPDGHVFRDMLITGNIFRNTFGWTSISEKRGQWSGGTSSDVHGMGGFGLYVDNASGIHVYRNIAYNNSNSGFQLYDLWWDGDIVYYNNIAANSLNGLRLDGNTQSSINTQIANNIFINNEGYGALIYQAQGDYGNFLLDHNLYFNNGWRPDVDGGMQKPGDMAVYNPNDYYQTLAEIQLNTPWEDFGIEGDPSFLEYDYSDHNLFDNTWPDFHLTSASSNALEKGTTSLPVSLIKLLEEFEITDFRNGQAYDIGRYEGGFAIHADPDTQTLCLRGTVRYILWIDPLDFPQQVSITVTNSLPSEIISLSSPILTSNETITLTIVDNHIGSFLPKISDTIEIIATGGGYVETASVHLLLGGSRDHSINPFRCR